MSPPTPIPITILTGFLGSGKTTLLLSLLPQLLASNPSYKLALLKNEFGDLAIDSKLAESKSIGEVRELLNGCICCNLIGDLSSALEELTGGKDGEDGEGEDGDGKDGDGKGEGEGSGRRIDRIVIETSGSAFPATLAMEINRLSRTTHGRYILDGVITVIDVENWKGYEDTSYTAKVQARYTDLVVFNKWELAGEARWEECLDRFGDLEGVEVPWVKSRRGWIDAGLVFGVDGGLARGLGVGEDGEGKGGHGHAGEGHEGHEHEKDHQSEVEVLSVTLTSPTAASINNASLTKLLTTAPKDEIYRIKAIFTSSTPLPSSDPSATSTNTSENSNTQKGSERYILNWAFGRWTTTPQLSAAEKEGAEGEKGDGDVVLRMTIVLARFSSKKWTKKIEGGGLLELDGNHGKGELKIVRIT